jgi:hypothetical protein
MKISDAILKMREYRKAESFAEDFLVASVYGFMPGKISDEPSYSGKERSQFFSGRWCRN